MKGAETIARFLSTKSEEASPGMTGDAEHGKGEKLSWLANTTLASLTFKFGWHNHLSG